VPSPYRVVKMPGDGSCLFHLLSYLMHGNTQLSYDIRGSIVPHVIKSWERFEVWTDDGNGDNFHVT
jgi:hypothetical protein